MILVLSCCLWVITFDFLFYKINYSIYGIFEPIQRKIEHLNEENRRKYKRNINILGLAIMLGITRFTLSEGVEGLILGLLFSIKNMCFRDTFIEIYKNEVAKKQ